MLNLLLFPLLWGFDDPFIPVHDIKDGHCNTVSFTGKYGISIMRSETVLNVN